MENKKLHNIIEFYYLTTTLKEKIRQGWIYWNVSGDRLESIAEHIYGTIMLAVSMYCEFDYNINIHKVITMLALHETEEIIIGDFTPFDNISSEDKLNLGNSAVNEIFKNISNKEQFISIIDEFNKKETKEAKFAFYCDKLECDLQAKKYSYDKKAMFEYAPKFVMEDKRVDTIIKNGVKDVGDVFCENDRNKYLDDNFIKVLDYVINENLSDVFE